MKTMTNEEYKEYNKIMYKAINYFVKKYNFKEIDELESCGTEALVYSLKNYDEKKGSKFTTYLYNNCIYSFFNNIEKNQKAKLNEWTDYKKEKLKINKEEVFNIFFKENESIEKQINNEKIYKIILEIINNKKFKIFYNEKIKLNKCIKSLENEDLFNLDKTLVNRIKKILKENYNIDQNDVIFDNF